MNDLDGDRPAGRLVGSTEHHAHRARAQDLLEAEGTELFADEPLTHGHYQNLAAGLEPLDKTPGGPIREPEYAASPEHGPTHSHGKVFGADSRQPRGIAHEGHPPRGDSCGERSPSPSDRR